MGNCWGNGKLIKELGDIGAKSLPVWIALIALKLTSIGLIAMKFIEKDFFENYYALIFILAIMVFFLFMIFYAVLLDENERTIATLIPITFIYVTACAVSSGALAVIFISMSPPILVVVNLVLWSTVYIATVFIYCQKEQSLDGSAELPLVSIITMNGDGNAPEQPVTQKMPVSGNGEELEMTGFEQFREDDGDGDGSVEIET
ncbi:unnamed protein product [Trifolium pratense]|uniref:Uncharacterized protein n=1 Tax=Trifolium pratense TaxID=57577 RepID=A0ACB0L925_TRIPR|nr:unnamed protein product [Trifolium pratense]